MTDKKSALILIDLQRDFLSDDGRLPVDRGQVPPLLEAVSRRVSGARHTGLPVIHVVNTFPRWSIANLFRKFAAIEGSPGALRDPRTPSPVDDELVAKKAASSAFTNADFDRRLAASGIERLVLMGVFAGGCVAATARDALGRGYAVDVVATAVADRNAAARDRALRKLEAMGCQIVDNDIEDHSPMEVTA